MVDILLAAYNGEMYIAEQIESILAQTYDDWRLIICDDCSADKTADIVSGFVNRCPDKIILHINEKPSGSAKNNFLGMLKYAEGDYIMFCDQDDVWLPNKIELSLGAVRNCEKENPGVPVLVHSDLIITDSYLNIKCKSFFEYQGLDGNIMSLNRLLVHNNVTGCTVLINKHLSELLRSAGGDILMHDWWSALIASAFGKICFISEPTVLYRQHERNQLGAVNNRNIKGVFRAAVKRKDYLERISRTFTQAESFYKVYKDILTDEKRRCLELFISIPGKNKLRRVYRLFRYGYLKQNLTTILGQLIFY